MDEAMDELEELEELVRAGLRAQASRLPDDAGLLAAVHARSSRIRRRRRLLVAAPAVLVVAVAALALVPRPDGGAGSVAPVLAPGPDRGPDGGSGDRSGRTASASLPPAPASSPARSGTVPPSSAPAAGRDCLSDLVPAATLAVPVFPLRLGPDIAARMESPLVGLVDGELRAEYAARNPVPDADITLVVSSRALAPAAAAGTGEVAGEGVAEAGRTGLTVRGHPAVLRTVAVSPAAVLELSWQEGADRWVRLRTDDTYTPAQVVAFAEGLRPAALALPQAFRFTVVPAGSVPVTMTGARVVLRAGTGRADGDPASSRVEVTRDDSGRQPGPGERARPVRVGGRTGYLSRDGASTTMAVGYPDDGVAVRVVATCTPTAGDAGLIRLAAGIRPTPAAP